MNWRARLVAELPQLHGWSAAPQPLPDFDASLSNLEAQGPTWYANLRTLAEQLPVGATLDVGGGDGVGAAILAALGHRVTLLDLAPWQLRRAETSAQWGVAFVRGEAEDLPFAEAAFDNVFCHHALEHVAAPLFALCECNRVTKAGGWLALGVPPPAVNTAVASHLHDFNAALLSYLLAVAGYRVGSFSQRSYDLRVVSQKDGEPFDCGLSVRGLCHRLPAEFWHEEDGRVWLCDEYRAPGRLHEVAIEGPER